MSYNFCGVVVGSAGCGKTTLARALIAKFVAEKPNGIVLASDPVRQYVKDGATYYDDANAWRAAMMQAAREKKPVARVSSIGGRPQEVTELAIEIGQRAGNSADDVRVPILMPHDESSLANERTFVSSQVNQLQATRRHLGVGILYLTQQPGQLNQAYFNAATNIYLFRVRRGHLKRLADLADVEEFEIAHATELPNFAYIEIQQGLGVVS